MQPRPVRYYLRLRFLQAWRFFPEHDIHPVVGVVIVVGIAGAVTGLLFIRTHWAPWILAGIPPLLSFFLRNAKAARELRLLLSPLQRAGCRLGEAMLPALPFLLTLLALNHWPPALVSVIVTALACVPEEAALPQLPVLSSPFPAPAFEWHRAWRRAFGVFLLYGALICVAAAVHNGAIAVVGFILLMAVVCASYGEPEAAEMVCIHRTGAGKFLWRKLRLAGVGYAMLLSPLPLAAVFFFRDVLPFIVIAGATGALWLCGCVLLKYQFYPNAFAVQLAQAFLFLFAVAALAAPPVLLLLLLVCIFSFVRARSRLRFCLPC